MTAGGDTLDGNPAGGGSASSSPSPGKVKNGGSRRDLVVAAAAGGTAAFMVGMAYAAVPFYSWFCKTTGYGGVPQVAHAAPGQVLDRKITVRFDANLGPGLPWKFEPERNSIDVRLGEVVTVYFTATNQSDQAIGAQAGYNVTPTTVGSYFTKINCFCFSEQHLAPREKREMAVVFYVDPELAKDSDQDDLNTITLSYTFFALRPEPRKGGVADGTSQTDAERKKI